MGTYRRKTQDVEALRYIGSEVDKQGVVVWAQSVVGWIPWHDRFLRKNEQGITQQPYSNELVLLNGQGLFEVVHEGYWLVNFNGKLKRVENDKFKSEFDFVDDETKDVRVLLRSNGEWHEIKAVKEFLATTYGVSI